MVNENEDDAGAANGLASLMALDPARYFASLFAPSSRRTGLVNLHLLDLRLAAARRDASELQIALIKLAWWRDALADLPARAAAGEPLLAALAAADVGDWPPLLAALAEAHMDMAEGQADAPARRGRALFVAAGALLSPRANQDVLKSAGGAWGAGRRMASETQIPAVLRPITALCRVADDKGRSPARTQFAMLAHILTGRP